MSILQGKEKCEYLYSYTKVNLNYCVGVKEKLPKKSDRNQDRDSEAGKL